MFRLGIFAGACALSIALSGTANATPLILDGSTTGTTFSNCIGCATSSSTALTWDAGTLTNDPLSFNATGATLGLHLAELVMTVDNNPSVSATFDYDLVLDITTPSLGSSTYAFSLGISASGSGVNSNSKVTSLVFSSSSPAFPTSIDLTNGFSLTNFAFDAEIPGGSIATTSFSGGDWSVTGHSEGDSIASADLFLTADVVPTNGQQQLDVPEPASMVLFGSGLLAFGAFRRVRKSK